MKRSSRELKENARVILNGRYGIFIGAFLVYFLIAMAIESVPVFFLRTNGTSGVLISQLINLILSLIIGILAAGFNRLSLNVSRGMQAGVSDLFYCFSHHPDRVIVVNFLVSLISIACQIPTIIITVSLGFQSFYDTPLSWIAGLILCAFVFGIISYIITLGFSLSIPLLIDNPEMGAIEAMKTSVTLMKGNKGRYFYISLSFIGISLLCVLSFGIGYLWAFPYMSVTFMEFYRETIGELDGGPRDQIYSDYSSPDTWS